MGGKLKFARKNRKRKSHGKLENRKNRKSKKVEK
jgi:hypothetical protein